MCECCSRKRGYNHQYGQDSNDLPPGFSGYSCPDTYKVGIFRYPKIPWKATRCGSNSPNVKTFPRNITMQELMQQKLCLNNSNTSQNVVIQLAPRNYGEFSKKMEFRGDNLERMKMKLSDLDQYMDRSSGQPDIWIWVSDSGMH